MNRYTDVDALLNSLPNEPYKGTLRRILMQAPIVDAVEVVRCKDCEYYDSHYTNCDHPRHDRQELLVIQKPDDYCSYAERRSE